MQSTWRIVILSDVETWIRGLSPPQQVKVAAALDALRLRGPGMGRPKVDTVSGSRYSNMKELRAGSLRLLFAFYPDRTAVVLMGGDKRDRWASWYREAIPEVDALFTQWLEMRGRTR